MSAWQRLGTWFKTAAREHWPPLLLLVVPIGFVVWGTKFETALPLLVLPVVAFIVGYRLRPRHVWLVWLGAIVVQWIAMGILGKYNDPEDETVLSLILEAPFWMAAGVLLPLWLGRTVRAGVEEDRKSGAAPKEPAA